ncbi:QacE family quaternary ammonium compound efflux SMR transporter, partial [Bacillus sp. JJ1521]
VGTALTAVIGALVWGEVFSALKLAGIILIIGGVILLNSSKSEEIENPKAKAL